MQHTPQAALLKLIDMWQEVLEKMKRSRALVVIVAALLLHGEAISAQEAISKEQLIQLVEEGVSSPVILDLLERDCVAFTLDATTVLDLSKLVPEEILRAAIACSSARDSLLSEATPPGATPSVGDIDLAAEPALALDAVKTVALVPFTVDGQPDAGITSVFRERLEKSGSRFKIIDSLSLAVHFEDTGSFHSDAPVKSLLAAARSVGANALFLGTASKYTVLGYPAIRLDVRIVEVNRGSVLWSGGGASKGGGWSWQHAKKVAAGKVAKKLPK